MDIQFNTNEDYNKLALSELRKRLKEQSIDFQLTDDAKKILAKEGFA